MKNSKKIYFGLLLIIVFLISTMYFSYAFFTSINEEHGKLNIVAGTLNYKIESKDLENNQITIKPNSIKKITIKLTSLNEIDSKYELFYETTNNDVEVGYIKDILPTGTINAKSSKEIEVLLSNTSTNDATVTFSCEGGFINDLLVKSKGISIKSQTSICENYTTHVWNYDYTGDVQEFISPCDGVYTMETWGASGGISGYHTTNDVGQGKGAYTKGNINLASKTNIYIYVGKEGISTSYKNLTKEYDFNGGGYANIRPTDTTGDNLSSGGGATDIRITNGKWDDFNSLKSRIMVAAGGAGGSYDGSEPGAGGGLVGYDGVKATSNWWASLNAGYGANQTKPGKLSGDNYLIIGGFGYGGTSSGGNSGGGAGGSGWYGGSGGYVQSGGGGSSFISGHNGCVAIQASSTKDNIIQKLDINNETCADGTTDMTCSYHYSDYIFTDTVMIDGAGYNWTTEKGNVVVGMPTHDGTSTMIGNKGNGYAKITYLGKANNKYDTYKIGDEVTLKDGSKWHVLEYSGYDNKYVTLLSDYNLNSNGSYNDGCQGNINNSQSYQCSTMAFDVDGTNIYDQNDSNNIGYFMKNTYTPLVKKSFPDIINVTLPTVQQISLVEKTNDIQNGFSIQSDWLKTTNYWTKSAFNNTTDQVFSVYGYYSSVNSYNSIYSGGMGVRPVITTLKSNIIKTIPSSTELLVGTSVEAIDGSKWHVLENSGSDSKYVTLLSDYNLNDDGTYNTECRKDINNTGICSSRVFSVGVQGVYDETNPENIGYFIKNTYAPLVSMLETTNITLPTAEQILKADSKEFSQFPDVADENAIILSNNWLTNLSYWTKTISDVNNHYVYVVLSNQQFFLRFFSSKSYGARPVITTLKTNLLLK